MINADKKKEMKNLSEMLLETRNLTKQYGHHKAVDSVNMHIKKGAIYGFIGRNGAGKTTCLKMISGLSKPTCGEIEMFGYKGKDLQKVRSRIGCLIEAPGLYGNMTAYENLNIKCKLFGIKKKSYIEEILRIIGLEDVGKKKTKHFSLGMKQRLGIGLALVGEPDLLVLDEPINGLDPQGIAEIRDTIQRLQKEKNMTICISSHILEELSKIATDYGIIHNGSLLQEITREELIRRCSERIELTLDHPKQAIPVLDSMGFTNYQVTDKEHIHIFERLNESAALNMELAKSGISSGYIKNIGGQVRNRGTLIFSRAIALAVFTVLTMAGAFLFQAAANGIVFGELEWGNTKAILSYFVTELALHYALVLICMAIAIILKNNVISMVIAVCLSMNVMTIVYGVINSAIQKIGIQNFQIYKYTITGKLSLLPMNPSGNECLAAFGVAIVFIVMMISVSSVVFQKRDI